MENQEPKITEEEYRQRIVQLKDFLLVKSTESESLVKEVEQLKIKLEEEKKNMSEKTKIYIKERDELLKQKNESESKMMDMQYIIAKLKRRFKFLTWLFYPNDNKE